MVRWYEIRLTVRVSRRFGLRSYSVDFFLLSQLRVYLDKETNEYTEG